MSLSFSFANCSSSAESPKDSFLFGVSNSFSGTLGLGLLSRKSVPGIPFPFCMGSLKSFLVDSAKGTFSLLFNVWTYPTSVSLSTGVICSISKGSSVAT